MNEFNKIQEWTFLFCYHLSTTNASALKWWCAWHIVILSKYPNCRAVFGCIVATKNFQYISWCTWISINPWSMRYSLGCVQFFYFQMMPWIFFLTGMKEKKKKEKGQKSFTVLYTSRWDQKGELLHELSTNKTKKIFIYHTTTSHWCLSDWLSFADWVNFWFKQNSPGL